MMKKLIPILAVLLCGCLSVPVQSAEIVNAAFTFSGTPSDGDTVTVNSTVRTFRTSPSTPSTEIEIDGQNGSAENMYQHYLNYPESGLRVAYNAADIVTLSTFPTTSISASESSAVIAVALSTNSFAESQVVRIPASSVADTGSTNRTYVADELADWLSDYNTNPIEFPDGAVGTPSISFQSDTDSGIYWISANKWALVANGAVQAYIENGTLTYTGNLVGTNGTLTSVTLASPATTGLVNSGSAISSTGGGSSSEQFGTSATATGNNSLAVGNTADASGTSSTSIGYNSEASATSTTALGVAATASAINGIAIGNNSLASGAAGISIGESSDATGANTVALGDSAQATADGAQAIGSNSVASDTNTATLGYAAVADEAGSVAIGYLANTTAEDQIRLGTSSDFVSIPGDLDVDGDIYEAQIYQLETPRLDNTSLSSGNNAAVNISTNAFVRISSGPGAAFTINGIAGGADGRRVTIYNATAFNMTIANDSGVDPTAANRIYTLTGSDYATTGTGAVSLIYDSGASRWILISARD